MRGQYRVGNFLTFYPIQKRYFPPFVSALCHFSKKANSCITVLYRHSERQLVVSLCNTVTKFKQVLTFAHTMMQTHNPDKPTPDPLDDRASSTRLLMS